MSIPFLRRLADRQWASIPYGPGLYCLFLLGRPVYIGQTKRLRARLQNHLSVCVTQCLIGNFRVHPEISSKLRFSVQPCLPKETREAMETWLIAKYKPIFNCMISRKNSRIAEKKGNYYRAS
jgi:excinuclease UvrABC nuclease subunit